MVTSAIRVELDAKQLAAFRKRVERWQGAPLRARLQKGTLQAGDYLARPIKAATPRQRGMLRKSVRSRPLRGESGAEVGPTAPHAHLVIKGTGGHPLETKRAGKSQYAVLGLSNVTRSGGAKRGTSGLAGVGIRATASLHHPGSKGNPFVDEATQRHSGDAVRIVSDILFGEG